MFRYKVRLKKTSNTTSRFSFHILTKFAGKAVNQISY